MNFHGLKKWLAVASVAGFVGFPGASRATFAEGEEAYLRDDSWGAFLKFAEMARQGEAASQAMVGRMYFLGLGAPRDFRAAAISYEKAANQGHAAAQFQLAKLYANGVGVKQDQVRAAQWMEKSADQGVLWAMVGIGQMYQHGSGVTQDAVQALKWMSLAAASTESAETAETIRQAKKAKAELGASLTAERVQESQTLARQWNAAKRVRDAQWQKPIYRPLDVQAPAVKPADAADAKPDPNATLTRDYFPQSK